LPVTFPNTLICRCEKVVGIELNVTEAAPPAPTTVVAIDSNAVAIVGTTELLAVLYPPLPLGLVPLTLNV